ncbi:MAG: DUF433 domain-containing protein [Gemmataceae bacterium]
MAGRLRRSRLPEPIQGEPFVNPNISQGAVEEMLVQHLLTERLFRNNFDSQEFLSRNIIAAEVETVVDALVKKRFNRDDFQKSLDRFYMAIENAAHTMPEFSAAGVDAVCLVECFWRFTCPLPRRRPSMPITLHADPLPLHVDDTDAIRVGQSRVTLDVLLQYRRLGMKPEEIARGLDTLTLADVHGALAYYFRHQSEIDNYLRRREEEAEKLRQEIESANAPRLTSLKARLDALKTKGNSGHAPTTD